MLPARSLRRWFHTYIWTTRSLANGVTIARTLLVLGVAGWMWAFRHDSFDKDRVTPILVLTVSALLDLVDGMLARRFGSWPCGRALDLMADIVLWTVLYGSVAAARVGDGETKSSSSWRVFCVLILSLEWTTTISMLSSSSDDWKKNILTKSKSTSLTFRESFLRIYLGNNLRNSLATFSIVGHFAFPVLCMVYMTTMNVNSDDKGVPDAPSKTTADFLFVVVVALATVGLLLYLYATLAMLLATTTLLQALNGEKTGSKVQSWMQNRPQLSPKPPLSWIFLFHFLTMPLAVLLLLAATRQPTGPKTAAATCFVLVRVVTCVLFYHGFCKNSCQAASASCSKATTTAMARHAKPRANTKSLPLTLGDLWCTLMPLIAYAEVGAILPLLHEASFLQDMSVDHAILNVEAYWFGGQQPSVVLQPTNSFWKEFWHTVYVSHTPAIALVGLCFLSRRWRPATTTTTTTANGSDSKYEDTSSILLSNMLCTNFACHLLYLIVPTYGPLFTLDSASSVLGASASQSSDIHISKGVVSLGQRFASTGTACPSSHCATAACIGITLTCCIRTTKWSRTVSVIWSVAICISTVVCGMHYVLDVVAGILVGTICCAPTIYDYFNSTRSFRGGEEANADGNMEKKMTRVRCHQQSSGTSRPLRALLWIYILFLHHVLPQATVLDGSGVSN